MKLIIVPDKVPENPYRNVDLKAISSSKANVIIGKQFGFTQGQQSILSLPSISVEELDAAAIKWYIYFFQSLSAGEDAKLFSEFLQKQECLKAKEAGL